jgi:hypothetical protein
MGDAPPWDQHSAKFWRRVLLPVIERYRRLDVPKVFRGDAASSFANMVRLLLLGAYPSGDK